MLETSPKMSTLDHPGDHLSTRADKKRGFLSISPSCSYSRPLYTFRWSRRSSNFKWRKLIFFRFAHRESSSTQRRSVKLLYIFWSWHLSSASLTTPAPHAVQENSRNQNNGKSGERRQEGLSFRCLSGSVRRNCAQENDNPNRKLKNFISWICRVPKIHVQNTNTSARLKVPQTVPGKYLQLCLVSMKKVKSYSRDSMQPVFRWSTPKSSIHVSSIFVFLCTVQSMQLMI